MSPRGSAEAEAEAEAMSMTLNLSDLPSSLREALLQFIVALEVSAV
jgi:hypothetical protein